MCNGNTQKDTTEAGHVTRKFPFSSSFNIAMIQKGTRSLQVKTKPTAINSIGSKKKISYHLV